MEIGGGTCTVVPQDTAVRGYWELTVAGVKKVVIRGACCHTPNGVALRVERAEWTGTA
jgi:aspartate/tyrosine/aromatic aminotransferase